MGQRSRLRPRRIGVDARRRPRAAHGAQASVRHGVDQHAHPARERDAARRLQAERLRQGPLGRGTARLHEHQARDGGDLVSARPYYVAGEWRTGEGLFEVTSPFDGSVVEEIAKPTDADVEEAVAKASEAFRETQHLPAHARANALAHVSKRIAERGDEVAEIIAKEGGKPLKWSRIEAQRAASTFRIAAEEARRFGGEFMRLDTEASLGSRVGIVRRFPFGPVLGITPFNFPVNLVAHKVAPSLAVGAPIVVKPATKTPLGALFLAELIAETELPGPIYSVLPVPSAKAEELVKDRRFKKVSFTGSSGVGWHLKQIADPRTRFTLELGGNAGVIVHSDADLDHAAERVSIGGYYQAGQSCIAVQRVLVQAQVHDDFVQRLFKQVDGLKVGDP